MDINYVYKHACRVDWSHATEMHHHSGNTVTQHKFVYYHKYRERGVCRERHHSLISDLWLGHTINSIYGNKGQAGINTIFVGGNAELLIATQPQEQSYTLKLGKPSIVCNWTHTHTHSLSLSLSLSLSCWLAWHWSADLHKHQSHSYIRIWLLTHLPKIAHPSLPYMVKFRAAMHRVHFTLQTSSSGHMHKHHCHHPSQ